MTSGVPKIPQGHTPEQVSEATKQSSQTIEDDLDFYDSVPSSGRGEVDVN